MVWFWSQSFCSDLQHHLSESTQLHPFCLMEEMEPPSVCAWGNSGRPREVWDLGNSVTPALFQLDLVPLRGLDWSRGMVLNVSEQVLLLVEGQDRSIQGVVRLQVLAEGCLTAICPVFHVVLA